MTALLRSLAAASREIIGPNASSVDMECRFPSESVAALKSMGMMGYFIPREMGGIGGEMGEFCECAALLGEHCLSTAIIWTMHCQMSAVLATYPFEEKKRILQDIVTHQHLVASITTEVGKGGDFLRTKSPVEFGSDSILLQRKAPIVAYGREAKYFLITMKSGTAENSTGIFLVKREDGSIKEEEAWKSLGLRGTQNLSLDIDVKIAPGAMIGAQFQKIATECTIPISHLGWSSAWFGAAKGLYNKVLRALRRSGAMGMKKLDSELLRHRLGEVRLKLDMLESVIVLAVSRLKEIERSVTPTSGYRDPSFNILLNGVKVAVSENSFWVVDRLMEISGLFEGYMHKDDGDLERVFRDIRSATLMFNNDRLLGTNGQLAFMERPRLFNSRLCDGDPDGEELLERRGMNYG